MFRGAAIFVLVLASVGEAAPRKLDEYNGTVSAPGGAGHALLFRDQVLVKKDFKDFPTTALTFEAWISSSDFCHAGTIMSYALDSKSSDESQRTADFNHFVIFDTRNLLACHDYKYIDLRPDPNNESCHTAYSTVSKLEETARYVERDSAWHHLAVTWTADNNGETNIYMDGLLMATAFTKKTKPLQPGGALMLGGEQDCFGGCTDPMQGFYGLMDEVRIWKRALTQPEILRQMRLSTGLENLPDLVAYWKFNDADNDIGQFRRHLVAKDSSGKGNDLSLANPPMRMDVEVKHSGGSLKTGKLEFKNNVALGKGVKNMPAGSFSVEFWAKGQGLAKGSQQKFSQFLSYATMRTREDGSGNPQFMDDAIRIERYLEDFSDKLASRQKTAGAISVHINSNENTDSETHQNWIDFDAGWVDSNWHHLAVTWEQQTGETKLYLDGDSKVPFWKSDKGYTQDTAVDKGGVSPYVAAETDRDETGSLALGQDQDCFGGCFTPSNAFNGDMAVLRIWNRVVSQEEVKHNMHREKPDNDNGLSSLYVFDEAGMQTMMSGAKFVTDRMPSHNHLELKGNPPQFTYSTAPLTGADGSAVMPPHPGAAGYSLALHDKQVLILPNFADFPSEAITVEFWMWSVDTCRPGVPFSYAHGRYEHNDNAFLLFNYNSWGISVMEDEGLKSDHQSGVSATDGAWHHVAVTWESSTGAAVLYDNGRPVWRVERARGKKIPAGGTLVIGREQDCEGGCFDSATGASGHVSIIKDQEYGPQDFFGVVEEMRVWKVVRSPEQIRQGMDSDDGRGTGGFFKPGVDPEHPDLVAYWKFDEGQGYKVKDATNHGHDLIITAEPTWEVVRWLSTCGNGVVEGLEECDDGDQDDSDGCSRDCKVTPGWTCKGSPSVCTKGGSKSGGTPPPPRPLPSPVPSHETGHDAHSGGHDGLQPGSSSGDAPPSSVPHGGRRSHMGAIMAGVLVPLVLLLLAGAGVAYRHAIYEQFPQVERGVEAVASSISSLIPGSKPSTYHHLSIDPEELDLAPEFLASQPARVAPGHAGSYEPMNDQRAPSGF